MNPLSDETTKKTQGVFEGKHQHLQPTFQFLPLEQPAAASNSGGPICLLPAKNPQSRYAWGVSVFLQQVTAHLPVFASRAASCCLKLRWAHLFAVSDLNFEVMAALTEVQNPIQLLADDVDLVWGLWVAPQDEAR